MLLLQVANKLYPLTSISQQIEHFANEMLMSVSTVDHKADSNGDGSSPALQKVLILIMKTEFIVNIFWLAVAFVRLGGGVGWGCSSHF